MAYSLENCQFLNTDYVGLDTSYPSTIASPNNRYLIAVRNCFFSGRSMRNSNTASLGSLGYFIRTCAGSITIENSTFESLYRGILMGSSGGQGLEDVKNVKIRSSTFDQIDSTAITGHGVQSTIIVDNQFYGVCQGSSTLVSDAAVYLDYQSDGNIVSGNQFGMDAIAPAPRFYIVLQPAGTPFLKIPTGNCITNNSFLRATAG